MKKLLAALVAVLFTLSTTAAFAQTKQDEPKKDEPKKEEPKKKDKKGGC